MKNQNEHRKYANFWELVRHLQTYKEIPRSSRNSRKVQQKPENELPIQKKCPYGSLAQMIHDILEMKQKVLCWQYTLKYVSFANCFYLSIE